MVKSRSKFFNFFSFSIAMIMLSCVNMQARGFEVIKIVQDSTKQLASEQAKELFNNGDFDQLRALCLKQVPILLKQEPKDSLEIASMYFYQFEVQGFDKDYLASLKSTKQGIQYCDNSEEGAELKGMLYYKQAYSEDALNFSKRSLKSMEMASSILSSLKTPNYDYSIGAYNFLSQDAAYRGDLKEAQRFLRLSEKFYKDNKEVVDIARKDEDGFNDRYEVILPYKKLYLLYKRGKSSEDSIQIIQLIKELETLHASPEFSVKYESVYYTTALNHMGDWYASRNPEEITTAADLEKARYYIDKSIDLISDKGYVGNEFTFKYNKSKLLALSNELEEADSVISDLLSRLSSNDGRRPFFIAQKGLIKAKMKQKDSALTLFYKVIENVHSGEEKLKKDYSNFEPNTVFGQTKLILRVAEVLGDYYPEDKEVQVYIARLYFMALLQFENSYAASSFNSTYDDYLRQIIQGILTMKKKGYGVELINNNDFLNRTETIQNQLAWKQFNQNRYLNSLPDLDSLKLRKLELRTMMASAKKENNTISKDSLYQLIIKIEGYTNNLYPNLNTVSEEYFDVQKLQQLLANDEVIIKYMLLKEQLAIYLIDKKEVKIELHPWTTEDKGRVISFYEDIKNQDYNTETAQQLASKLVPELDPKVNHIIIDPDGELYRFPYEVLHINDTFLINRYHLSYTSNLGFVYPELKQKNNDQELAIYIPNYADYSTESNTRANASILLGAQNEGNAISKLFSSKIYSDSTLTKQEFIATAEKASLLHLAMHAKVNNEEPELSRLVFSTTNDQTKDLYLEELYALSLRADLAVLSACNTGVGRENSGKSMESFQRAFTFAGVPATVASLWEVPDSSTKDIMEVFYMYLSEGFSKSKSLQNAKLAYIKKHENTKLGQPYYWAGFVVYGEDKAVVESNSNTPLYALLGSIGVIGLLGFFIRERRKQAA